MKSFLFFFLGLSNGFAFKLLPKDGCVIDSNSIFPSPDPLLLHPNVDYDLAIDYKKGFITPDKVSGLITLNVGEKIRFACPGTTLSLTGTLEENVTCVSGNDFQTSDGNVVSIDKLSCRSFPTDSALRRGSCIKDGTRVDLGFNLESFFPLISVCFNEKTLETYYAEELVVAELKGREIGQDRPSFKPDDFYNFDVNDMYTYAHQLVAFEELLGSEELATKYVSDQTSHYLARGHFSPQADFLFRSGQRATFHFVNVAPQWQSFNGGVWSSLESNVRDYAVNTGKDVIVYTGPLGALAYNDINGNPKEIFLAYPNTKDETIKVPKFYWKVVVEPITKRGVAFVGINDLSVPNPRPNDYIICNDVLSKITWAKFSNVTLLYACDVTEFARNSDNFPDFQVTSLLVD